MQTLLKEAQAVKAKSEAADETHESLVRVAEWHRHKGHHYARRPRSPFIRRLWALVRRRIPR